MKLTATNKFREDMGNGNAKTIATSLLDEYLPEYSYDNTSIPDTTYVFLEQTYQNKRLNEIFDFMAETLDRRWWVNENIKFILCDRNFSLVVAAITKSEVKDSLDVDLDSSKMANYVAVDGAKILRDIEESGTVRDGIGNAGGTSEFILSYMPETLIEILINGDKKTITKEGSEDYDNIDVYDGYIKIGAKKLQFNDNSLDGNFGTVIYQTFSAIHDELADGASIDEYGIKLERVIVSEEITSQADAANIAQNYLDNYSQPLKIISGTLIPQTQNQIEKWRIGNKVRITFDDIDDEFKIIETTYLFGISGIFISVKFTDEPETINDLLEQLILKIKQREEKERKSTDSIAKYFFWGGNLYYELENVSIRSQKQIGSQLIWGHPVSGTWGSFKWGGTTEPIEYLIVLNSSRGFIERFETNYFEGGGD